MAPAHIGLIEAIARQEGFGKPGVRPTRNHNPGNLNYGTLARGYGAISEDGAGYAVFTSNMDGYAALGALLASPAYRGKTVQQAIEKYAPPKGDPRGDNNVAVYVMNVCQWCGCRPDTIIDHILKEGVKPS